MSTGGNSTPNCNVTIGDQQYYSNLAQDVNNVLSKGMSYVNITILVCMLCCMSIMFFVAFKPTHCMPGQPYCEPSSGWNVVTVIIMLCILSSLGSTIYETYKLYQTNKKINEAKKAGRPCYNPSTNTILN